MLLKAWIQGGLLCLAVTGCQSYGPNGHGYQGQYGYPAGAPIMQGTPYPQGSVTYPQGQSFPPGSVTYPPGASAVPPGVSQVPGTYSPTATVPDGAYPPRGTAVSPSPRTQSQSFNTGPSTPRPGKEALGRESFSKGGSPAKAAAASPPATGQKLVPNYADPSMPPSLDAADDDAFGDPASFKQDQKGKPAAKPAADPATELKMLEEDDDVSQIPTEDPFQSPVPFQPASFSGEVAPGAQPTAATDSAARPNPYAHDAQNYGWFRGVVNYDEKGESWFVVYNPEPDSADIYGGSITLAQHPKQTVLRPNDVVLVKGKVDAAQTDRFGKPKFVIDFAGRLTPKKATAAAAAAAEKSTDADDAEEKIDATDEDDEESIEFVRPESDEAAAPAELPTGP